MGEFYEFPRGEKRIRQSDAVLRVTGDRNLPVMEALLDLYVKEPENWPGLLKSSQRTAIRCILRKYGSSDRLT